MTRPANLEILFFVQSGVYAAVVGVVYWFLAYEVVGTLMLLGFALGGFLMAGLLWFLGRPSRRARDPERPFADESGRIPSPTLAPVGAAFGAAFVVLGLAFGIWPVLVGLVLVAASVRTWLERAMAESRATEAEPPAGEAEPGA